MADSPRDKRIALRMTDNEHARMVEGAAQYGLDTSSYVRMLVHRDVEGLRASTKGQAAMAPRSNRRVLGGAGLSSRGA